MNYNQKYLNFFSFWVTVGCQQNQCDFYCWFYRTNNAKHMSLQLPCRINAKNHIGSIEQPMQKKCHIVASIVGNKCLDKFIKTRSLVLWYNEHRGVINLRVGIVASILSLKEEAINLLQTSSMSYRIFSTFCSLIWISN